MELQLNTTSNTVQPLQAKQITAIEASGKAQSAEIAFDSALADPAPLKTYFPMLVHNCVNEQGEYLTGNARYIMLALLALNKCQGWFGPLKTFARHIKMRAAAVRKTLEELASFDLVSVMTRKTYQVLIRPNWITLNKLQAKLLFKSPGQIGLSDDDYACLIGTPEGFAQARYCDQLVQAAKSGKDKSLNVFTDHEQVQSAEKAAMPATSEQKTDAKYDPALTKTDKLKTFFPIAINSCLNAKGKPLSGNARIILITLLAINECKGWYGSVRAFAGYIHMPEGAVRRAVSELSASNVGLLVTISNESDGSTILWPNWYRLNKLQAQLTQKTSGKNQNSTGNFICQSKDNIAFEEAMRCRQFMATHGMKEESLNTFATSDSNSAAPATYSAGTSAQYVEKAQQNAAAQAVQQPQARTATAQASAAGNATFRGGNVQQSSAATSSARPSTASAGSNSMQSSAAGSQSVQGTAAQPAAKSYGSNTISVNLLGLGKITQSSGSSNIFGTAQKQPQSAASAASRPQPQVTATAAAPATPQAAQGFNQPAGPSAVAVTAVKPNITQAQTAPAAPAATMPGAATQHAARTQAVPAEGMTSGTVAAGASAQADSQSQIPQKPVYKPGMSRSEYMDQVLKYVRSLNEESSKKARQQAAAQPQPAQQQQPELQNYGECPDMPANYTPMPDPRKYGIGTRPVTELDIRLAFKALKADPARCGCSIELMSKQMFFYHQHKTNWHMYCDKRRVEINLQNIQQACLFWLKGAEKRFAEKQQAARAAGMPQPQDR